MLSSEKARFKSILESTKSQIHSEIRLKTKLNHTRGILKSCATNFAIFTTFAPKETCRELIADFKKSWLTVSQILVKTIKKKMNKKPGLSIGYILLLAA
jgi:hypothetical protein